MLRKTVAIRGLDTELYHEVFSMAKKDGKRVAEVVNQALKAFIDEDYNNNGYSKNESDKNLNLYKLRNDGEISLSKKDIIGLKEQMGQFIIETSGKLVFEKDVDNESLNNIEKIVVHDGIVEVPRGLYHQVLIRSEIFGKIEKY